MQPEEKSYRDKWYSFYESVIYIIPGMLPQTKGAWTDSSIVESMVNSIKEQHPTAEIYVASVRCGEIQMESADEWVMMRKIGIECAEEQAAYIKAGICAKCGACSLKDAEDKCKPSQIADTGDYTCDGEQLWSDQE